MLGVVDPGGIHIRPWKHNTKLILNMVLNNNLHGTLLQQQANFHRDFLQSNVRGTHAFRLISFPLGLPLQNLGKLSLFLECILPNFIF